MKVICLGDVVGRPGRVGLQRLVPTLVKRYGADAVIINGENAAGGLGLDAKTADDIRASGATVVTLGDHTWQKKELKVAIESRTSWLIRPANYPPGAPGHGFVVVTVGGQKLGVMNLLGRVFINFPLDCPFRAADALLAGPLKDCKMIVCDMHAEATSEKLAMARHLDGRVSLVFGTHTHVQTADERVLPGGTAFISDLGMCGSQDGIIGMDARVALQRFLTGLPFAYEVAAGEPVLHGVVCEMDPATGKALHIERIREQVAEAVQGG
jgi:metallophosphoesterase (TIGR00282 family)